MPKKPKVTFKKVKIADIGVLNTPNPNAVPEKVMDSLRESVDRYGLFQVPVLRLDEEGKPQLVDGHHRLEVLRENGEKECMAAFIEASEQEAKLLRISTNRIKGTLDYQVMSEELKALVEDSAFTEAELPLLTGLSDHEVQALCADMDELEEVTKQPLELLPKDEGDMKLPRISIEFTNELDKAKVLTLLDQTYAGDRGTALLIALGLQETC